MVVFEVVENCSRAPIAKSVISIHEFAHLIDKADGATDGIPEYLLARPFVLPWATNMHQTVQAMKHNESNDINFYGTTNDAEFFAVVAEYFFEKPEALKNKITQNYMDY
jgi:Mlc titration factor MtfA (ptsG expression regulator)